MPVMVSAVPWRVTHPTRTQPYQISPLFSKGQALHSWELLLLLLFFPFPIICTAFLAMQAHSVAGKEGPLGPHIVHMRGCVIQQHMPPSLTI